MAAPSPVSVIGLFFVINGETTKLECFVPKKLFRASPIFTGKDRSFPVPTQMRPNIRLGWKDLTGTNTPAYSALPSVTEIFVASHSYENVKSGPNVLRLMYGHNL
jgi:hypothetical protein